MRVRTYISAMKYCEASCTYNGESLAIRLALGASERELGAAGKVALLALGASIQDSTENHTMQMCP